MTGAEAAGLSAPPEGVLAGESVPRENDEEDVEQAAVDELVGLLKTNPAYHGRPDSELEEIAREKLRSN